MKVIVGISGASGAIYGIEVLKALTKRRVETHLVFSDTGRFTVEFETKLSLDQVEKMATYVHHDDENPEYILSSVKPNVMVVAPCSMKTLAGIAWGYTDNLLLKVARKILQDGIELILLVRESPWNLIHLRNMLRVAEKGVVVMPASFSPSINLKSIDDIVESVVNKIIKALGLDTR